MEDSEFKKRLIEKFYSSGGAARKSYIGMNLQGKAGNEVAGKLPRSKEESAGLTDMNREGSYVAGQKTIKVSQDVAD